MGMGTIALGVAGGPAVVGTQAPAMFFQVL